MTQLTKRFLINYIAVVVVFTVFVLIFKSDLQSYIIGLLAITAGSVAGTGMRMWRTKKMVNQTLSQTDPKGTTVVLEKDDKNK